MSPGVLYCSECGTAAAPDDLARFGDRMVCPRCKDRYAQKLREGVPAAGAGIFAGFWIRFLAYVIDAIILAVAGSVVQFIFAGSLIATMPATQPGTVPSTEALGRLFGIIALLGLVNMAIAATYEALFLGKLAATPGKMVVGVKVIRADGSRITVARGFGRYFAKILSGLILLIGFIMAGFDAEKRALHDMICDTRVVKTRT